MKAECSTTTLLENWIEKSEEYGKCLGIHVISVDKNQVFFSKSCCLCYFLLFIMSIMLPLIHASAYPFNVKAQAGVGPG